MNATAALSLVQTVITAAHGGGLSEEASSELRVLFEQGHQRAVKRKDIARFDKEVVNLTFKLVAAAEVQQQHQIGGRDVTTVAGLGDAIRRLCPMWPFC